jgi:hypothetical protein
MRIYPVPSEFQPLPMIGYYNYPVHNSSVATLVEESTYKFMINAPDIEGVEYLPVLWTAYHISTGYGKRITELAEFIKAIPQDKKLFTTVQYDDGTLVGDYCEGRNILVFGAGGIGNIPIPLLCEAHPVSADNPRFFASFVGSPKTHPLRGELEKEFSGKSDSIFVCGTHRKDQLQFFRDTMKDTLFALCPRGYGKTSFRLYEAIQMGCIPVVVYDQRWLPFEDVLDWNSFAVLCHRSEIAGLYGRLKSIPAETLSKMSATLKLVQPMFTIEAMHHYIYSKVKNYKW